MTLHYKYQIDFISFLQRLMQEGDFTSTYKFAFLHALADICIEKNVQPNRKLKITFDEIVEKLIALYWQHAKPFSASGNNLGVLIQSTGNQAKIISDIQHLQNEGVKSVTAAKCSILWSDINRNTLRVLKEGPLWRLQILSKQEDCFLFAHVKNRSYIELNEGIANSFQRFHDLVVQFSRQGWIEKIIKIRSNQESIGLRGDLHDFLFSSNRQSLSKAKNIFNDIQKNLCFYCEKPIKNDPEVDHFIPFSKYSSDLGHNFVLAHKSCNNNKRDYLAAPKHRDRWIIQNLEDNNKLISKGLSEYFSCDIERTRHVANWAYQIAEINKNKFWLGKNRFV